MPADSVLSAQEHQDKLDHEHYIKWRKQWTDATVDTREVELRAISYRHGKQWTDGEAAKLEGRGQPVLTFNRIGKKINSINGNEIATRVDPKALPLASSPNLRHDREALAITDAIRHELDRKGPHGPYSRVRSKCTEDFNVIGTTAVAVEVDPETRNTTIRRIKRREFFYDPYSAEADYSDALYLGVSTWKDVQSWKDQYKPLADKGIAVSDYDSVIDNSIAAAHDVGEGLDDVMQWVDLDRKRIRVDEIYFFHKGEWHYAHYTFSGILIRRRKCPYKDESNKRSVCPILAQSLYVVDDDSDTAPLRYGRIRDMISPQDALNKGTSKLYHILNSKQAVTEDSALDNIKEARVQLAKPDGIVKVNDDALAEGRFQVVDQMQVAQGHFQMLANAQQMIDGIGPDIPNIAAEQRTTSGKEVLARQNLANMELAPGAEELHWLDQRVYQAVWQRIKQFKTKEWWARIRDDKRRVGWRFVGLNRKTNRRKKFREALQENISWRDALFIAAWPDELFDQVDLLEQSITQELQTQHQQMVQIAQQQQQPAPPQPTPEQIDQLVIQELLGHPLMDETITENDVAQIDVDITIDVVPDTTIARQEDHIKLSEMIASSPNLQTPQVLEMWIESSDLQNKEKLLNVLQQQQQPDPAQIELQQVELEKLKAEVQKLTAQAQALISKAQTDAETKPVIAEAEAERDKAHALKLAAEAGKAAAGGN